MDISSQLCSGFEQASFILNQTKVVDEAFEASLYIHGMLLGALAEGTDQIRRYKPYIHSRYP